MSEQAKRPEAATEMSLAPEQGWHCAHFFYHLNRSCLAGFDPTEWSSGRYEFSRVLEPEEEDERPAQIQSYIISGHKADFGVMMMDPDPLKLDRIHQRLLAGAFGQAIEPTWSFVSLTEVSEYVPSPEEFRAQQIRQGEAPDSPALQKKVEGYAARLPAMNAQRLTPQFPDWPVACFYPMNKSRVPGANWFLEPFSRRAAMMSEHGRSGMTFMGRVSQVITVGVGLDDWEWMVTLWGTNPSYLKEIVYKMRFDEASARYAEFGPFYVGYRATADEILDHCHIGH